MSLWLNDHPKKRKTIMTIVLVAFLLQIVIVPQPAYATGWPVIDIAGLLQGAVHWIRTNADKWIEKGLKVAAWKAFQTALQRFLGRIAYETAVWIGSGDKGKKPLLYTKGWKQYLEDAGDAAAGDFIETLADEWSGQADRKKQKGALEKELAIWDDYWTNRNCDQYRNNDTEFRASRPALASSKRTAGPDKIDDVGSFSCFDIQEDRKDIMKELGDLNTNIARTAPFLAAICTPPDGIQLKIALNLGTPSYPKASKCTFSQMRDNWETAVEDPAFLSKFSVSFEPGQSDLGIALDLQSNLLIEQDKKKASDVLTRGADGAFKSVTSGVTGVIQTPARFIDEKARKIIDEAYTPSKEQPPPGLLEGVATIFTNTLISSLGDRLQRGFWSLREVAEKKKSPNLGGLGGRGGSKEVEAVFASLKAVKLQPNSNFDVLSQFQQCPPELKQQLSIYSCVLDPNFADAVRGGSKGPMTVREAMDEGLLHGEWNFGYDDPAQGREPAFNTGYAASSMAKLRRFRILPLGWEFAAQYIRTKNQPYQLQQVVDCFEDPRSPADETLPSGCGQGQGAKNPFWHLVDPNWVLKAPQTNCRAWGPGQQIYKETGQRLDYCADAQDCVVEGENGACTTWGYCTREKNVWRLAADTCDAQYDTCLVVKKDRTDEELSALQNSWGRVGCNTQTSGCTAHALQTYDATKKNQDGSKGAWVNTTQQRFLTSQTPECSDRAVGCRAFIAMREDVNLVSNGTFEIGEEGKLPTGWSESQTSSFTKSLPIAQRGQSATLAKDFAGLQKAGTQQVTARVLVPGILPGHTYTVSAWAYIKTVPAQFRNIGVRLTELQGGSDIPFGSKLLDTTKVNQWQEVSFSATAGSGTIDAPKLWLVADAGAEVFWDDVSIADGAGSGMRPYGEGGMTYLRWTDETKPTLSCTKDEVGCTLYTPENGDPAKAGIIRPSDLCPNQCVGYATFTEQAPQNKFDVARDVNLIPSTAKSCQTEEVGCDEFTNLDEVAKGGEGLTYFTEIRQCQKPAPVSTDCAPFYTYEGSASSGAQLQSYVLKSAGNGDPATTDGTTTCNRSDANCRDFINAQGKHSFRDIRTTVTCANDCIPFRKTRSTAAQCTTTGGEWDGAACTYDIIKSEGKQCRREASGCRSYVGNTGHVLKTVARTDFERGKPTEWQSRKAVSAEAVRPGGHSLLLEPQETATWTLPSDTLKSGARYTIYFLAKQEIAFPNNAIAFTVSAKNSGATTQTFTQNISAAGWHDYTVGPIVASQQSGWTLEFQSSTALFLDDVLIRRTNDQYTLVRDSWNTPAACTQATIGCQAYRASNNDRLSFSRLTNSCAFEKVGCAAFIDTQNSSSPFSETWNAGDRAEVKTAEDKVTYLVNRPEYACRAEERGCTAVETLVPGTSGKPESKTTFLRDDPDLYGSILCASAAEGCSTYIGDGGPYYFKDPKEKLCEYRAIPGSRDSGWYKKNSKSFTPDCGTGWAKLCPEGQNRCTKFVDPLDVQKKEYPNGYAYFVLKNDNLDTSSCGTSVNRKAGCVLMHDTSNASAVYQAALTKEGADAPETKCVNPGGDRVVSLNTPSRPNEQALDIGSQKTFTLVPPLQTTDDVSYIIEFEAKTLLTGSVASVEVKLGATTGGDLTVGKTAVEASGWDRYVVGPVKVHRAADMLGTVILKETTGKQVAVENVLVKVACDANVIVKGVHDRTCGEWLACQSSVYQFDSVAGEYREVCTAVGRCKEENKDRPTECKTWAPGATYTEPFFDVSEYRLQRKSALWADNDYSGYSLPNRYPIETYAQVKRSPLHLTALRAKATPATCKLHTDCGTDGFCFNKKCFDDVGIDGSRNPESRKPKTCRLYPDTASPAPSSLGAFGPIPVTTQPSNQGKVPEISVCNGGPTPGIACSTKIGGATVCGTGGTCVTKKEHTTYLTGRKYGYSAATNVCQEDANNDGAISDDERFACECDYDRVTYKNGDIRYYTARSTPPGRLYDVDGEDDQETVTSFTATERQTYLGWRGYCLEDDMNPKALLPGKDVVQRPCFTWWPVDVLAGEVSLFANHPEAGYAATGKEYYCAMSELREYRSRYEGDEYDTIPRWLGPIVAGGTLIAGILVGAGAATAASSASVAKFIIAGATAVGSSAAAYAQNTGGSDACDRNYNEDIDIDDHLFKTTVEIHCNPKGGEGWYGYDGIAPKSTERVEEVCTRAVQIEKDGENRAFTSRVVNNTGNYQPKYPVSDLGYTQGDAAVPYGRVSQSGSPDIWGDPSPALNPLEASKDVARAGGRPYACYSPFGTCNLPPAVSSGLMADAADKGRDHLKELFAASYSTWASRIADVAGTCVGWCSFALPKTCISNTDCAIDRSGIGSSAVHSGVKYQCAADTCKRGYFNGESCASTNNCQLDLTNQGMCTASGFCSGGPRDTYSCTKKADCDPVDGTCVPRPTSANPNAKICDGGPYHEERCKTPADCSVAKANEGTCSGALMACQNAVSLRGGMLSGWECGTQAECDSTNAQCLPSHNFIDDKGLPQPISSYCSATGRPCTGIGTSCTAPPLPADYNVINKQGGDVPLWNVNEFNGIGDYPIVAAVVPDSGGGDVREGPRNRVSLGKRESGDLQGSNGALNVSLWFYAYNENGDQMPLRKVAIDWGDGTQSVPIEGWMRNHKNVCRRKNALICVVGSTATSTACTRDATTGVLKAGDPCTAYTAAQPTSQTGQCAQVQETVNFGDSRDACDQDDGINTPGYFVFNHVYQCTGKEKQFDATRNACVYKFGSAKVTDNWDRTSVGATYPDKIIVAP